MKRPTVSKFMLAPTLAVARSAFAAKALPLVFIGMAVDCGKWAGLSAGHPWHKIKDFVDYQATDTRGGP